MEVGKKEIVYLSLRCHHQNDSCIKTGSDESHFNVSFIARDKVTRQCPQTSTFEEKGEPKADSNRGPSAYQPNASPLGQTGSLMSMEDELRAMTQPAPVGHGTVAAGDCRERQASSSHHD